MRDKLLQPPVVHKLFIFFFLLFYMQTQVWKKRRGKLISCNHKLNIVFNITLFMLLRLTEHRLYSSNMQVDEHAIIIFNILNSYIKSYKAKKIWFTWKKSHFLILLNVFLNVFKRVFFFFDCQLSDNVHFNLSSIFPV